MELFQDHWLAACPAESLGGKPLGITLLERPLVLFRASGRAVALEDRCPHRNAPLSAGRLEEDLLVCPYHGWSFDGQGGCRRIPGRSFCDAARVPAFPCMERDGIVWVALGRPVGEPYRRGLEGYDSFVWSVEMPGSLVNVVENFLDATHTHFVHAGLIRGAGPRQSTRIEVVCEGDRVEASYFGEERASGLISRLFEGRRHSSHGRFILPGVAEIEYRSFSGTQFVMTAYIVPVRADLQRAQVIVATPRGLLPGWLKKVVLTPFLRAALAQDQAILRLQQRNIERFGEENFVSTELDVLRSHVLLLLKSGRRGSPVRRTILTEL